MAEKPKDGIAVSPLKDGEVKVQVNDNSMWNKVSGFRDYETAMHVVISKISHYYILDKDKKENCVDLAVRTMFDMGPKDSVEGMLCSQMLLTHDMAMDLLRRAKGAQHLEYLEKFVHSATKLMRTFTAQSEALNNHRGNRSTKVEVNNVNVNDGGQAIVGNVTNKK